MEGISINLSYAASLRSWNVRLYSMMNESSISYAATAAHWDGVTGLDVEWLVRSVIALTTSLLPQQYPILHPVIAWDLLTPLMTNVFSFIFLLSEAMEICSLS